MAVTATPIFPQALVAGQNVIVNGTGAYTFAAATAATNLTGLVSIVAGGTNGTVIEAITVTTTDTAANTLWLISINATTGAIFTVLTIPIGAGTTVAVPPVDVLRSSQVPGLSYDVNGNRIFYIPSGTTLYAGCSAAPTSLKQVSIIAYGGNF